MSYTLDDAHEALALIHHRNGSTNCYGLNSLQIETVVAIHLLSEKALDAIEAQLPEPCEHCGSDQCPTYSESGKTWPMCEAKRLGIRRPW